MVIKGSKMVRKGCYHNNFQEKLQETEDFSIPFSFLMFQRGFLLVDVPYCPKNEEFSKCLI